MKRRKLEHVFAGLKYSADIFGLKLMELITAFFPFATFVLRNFKDWTSTKLKPVPSKYNTLSFRLVLNATPLDLVYLICVFISKQPD
jgi:hypothetical protein